MLRVLIQQAHLLTRLFGHVLIPPAVFKELQNPETPDLVRSWLAADPLLLDEISARQEAACRKLPFIGTLGISSCVDPHNSA